MDYSTKFDEIKLNELPYAPYYCEENIWKFCEYIQNLPNTTQNNDVSSQVYVAFVSNENERVPLWRQKAAENEGNDYVVWDYHVFSLIVAPNGDTVVFDLDTTLDFPCPFQEYFNEAIKSDDDFNPNFQRKFRIIKAADYLENFSSDRKHMLDQNGHWLHKPPNWPQIMPPTGQPTNLHNFRSMVKTNSLVDDISIVLNTCEFRDKFSKMKLL